MIHGAAPCNTSLEESGRAGLYELYTSMNNYAREHAGWFDLMP
jgi:hypothetical protein